MNKGNNSCLNSIAVGQNSGLLSERAVKKLVFDNDPADSVLKLFKVTGTAAVQLVAVCLTDLTENPTITVEVGISGNTAALIAQTNAHNIDQFDIWHDSSPDSKIEDASIATVKFLSNSDIELKIGTAALTAGELEFYCFWVPISPDGNVESA